MINALLLQSYKENQIRTTDSATVLLMLYQGAIGALKQADAHLEKGNMAEKGICILRAYDIVSQFLLALDFEVGGELAYNLESLYLYIQEEITLANVTNDSKPLETAVFLLSTLKQGWEGAVVAQRQKAPQGGT